MQSLRKIKLQPRANHQLIDLRFPPRSTAPVIRGPSPGHPLMAHPFQSDVHLPPET